MEETSVGVGVGVAEKKETDSVKLANRIKKKKGNCKLESWFGA